MTRARDFADVISGNFDLPAGALDNASGETLFQKATVASAGAVSLDLSGDDNFFDAGTLTADTTVSFSNAPARKKFTYSFIPSYDSSEASVHDTDTWVADNTQNGMNAQLSGMHFYNNGLGFIGIWYGLDNIIKLELKRPYDLSSAKPFNTSTDVIRIGAMTGARGGIDKTSFGINTPRGLLVNSDGTRINFVCSTTDRYHSLVFSTGYDFTSYSTRETVSVSAYETTPAYVVANPDATRILISGQTGDDINEFTTSSFSASAYSYQRAVGSSANFTGSGLGCMLWGKNGNKLFGWQQTTPGQIMSMNTSANPYSLDGVLFENDKPKYTHTFGGEGNFTRAATWIPNDVIMPAFYEGVSKGYLIETGTSYTPTFSGTISGKLGHFSRSHRHFIDFETSNSGTNFGIIDHRKVYVG